MVRLARVARNLLRRRAQEKKSDEGRARRPPDLARQPNKSGYDDKGGNRGPIECSRDTISNRTKFRSPAEAEMLASGAEIKIVSRELPLIGAEWDRAVDLPLPLPPAIRAIGRSRAQCDLYEQMLIDAALKDGRFALARALLSERTLLRPRNAWGWRNTARAAAGLGDDAAARAATEEERRLLAA